MGKKRYRGKTALQWALLLRYNSEKHFQRYYSVWKDTEPDRPFLPKEERARIPPKAREDTKLAVYVNVKDCSAGTAKEWCEVYDITINAWKGRVHRHGPKSPRLFETREEAKENGYKLRGLANEHK